MKRFILMMFVLGLGGLALAKGWVETEPGSGVFIDSATIRETAPNTLRFWSRIGSGQMTDLEVRPVSGGFECRQAMRGGGVWSPWMKVDPNSPSVVLYRAAQKLPKYKPK